MSSSYIEHNLYIVNLSSAYITTFQGGVKFRRYNDYNPNFKLNSGWQTGLMYSRKGWAQSFGNIIPSLTTTMEYLVLPVDALVYWGDETKKLSLLIGIYGEYLVTHQSPSAPDLENLPGVDFYTFEPGRDNEFGYGLKGGISYARELGTSLVELSAYFDYSISNFIQTDVRSDPTPDTSNLFNFGVSLSYYLPILSQ